MDLLNHAPRRVGIFPLLLCPGLNSVLVAAFLKKKRSQFPCHTLVSFCQNCILNNGRGRSFFTNGPTHLYASSGICRLVRGPTTVSFTFKVLHCSQLSLYTQDTTGTESLFTHLTFGALVCHPCILKYLQCIIVFHDEYLIISDTRKTKRERDTNWIAIYLGSSFVASNQCRMK